MRLRRTTVKILRFKRVDEAVAWGAPTIYTVGTSRFVPVNRLGRYVALRLRSPSGEAWRIKSFDVDFEPKGLW